MENRSFGISFFCIDESSSFNWKNLFFETFSQVVEFQTTDVPFFAVPLNPKHCFLTTLVFFSVPL